MVGWIRVVCVVLCAALSWACSESGSTASSGDQDAGITSDTADGVLVDMGLGDSATDAPPPDGEGDDGDVSSSPDVPLSDGETSDGIPGADLTDIWPAETDGGDGETSDWNPGPDLTDIWPAETDGGDGETSDWNPGPDLTDSWFPVDAETTDWNPGPDLTDIWPAETDGGDASWDADGVSLDVWEDALPDANDDECPIDLQQIFIITDAYWLLRFEPETLNVVPLGMVNCPAFGGTPFSMAVDREGYAWVLYSDGSLWRVNTGDVSCTGTNYVSGQQGFSVFGMGFSSDGPATNTETLFISGGDFADFNFETGSLGSIAQPSLMVSTVAQFPVGPGSPELTGTRFGELWGFFAMSMPSHVSRINKQTAALEQTWPLPNSVMMPEAWAFAHWGGDFYLFFKGQGAITSAAWHLSGATGVATEVVPNLGHTITGAGVSTCAPAE